MERLNPKVWKIEGISPIVFGITRKNENANHFFCLVLTKKKERKEEYIYIFSTNNNNRVKLVWSTKSWKRVLSL